MAIWDTFTNCKQWEAYLKQLVKENNKALLRSIMLVYGNQTADERNAGSTVHGNKKGFSKPDAERLTALAIKIENGIPLSPGEMAMARNKMGKYWRQMMAASKERQARKIEQAAETTGVECPCDNGICDECSGGITNDVSSGNVSDMR